MKALHFSVAEEHRGICFSPNSLLSSGSLLPQCRASALEPRTSALNERRALLHPRCTLDLASEGRIIDKACIGDRGIHRAAVDGARIRGIHRAAADGARIHSIGSRSREGGADSVHQSPYTSQSCSYCHHTQTPAPLAPPLSRACQPIPLRAALDQPRVVG